MSCGPPPAAVKRSGFSGRRQRLKPVSDKRRAEAPEGPRRARKRLPARSAKRVKADRAKPEIRRAVFDRDGWTCRLKDTTDVLAHSCSGLTVHHLLKASQGGEYTEENLVTLCSVANDLIEDHPQRAWELGLVVRQGESTADAWVRMTAAGLVSPPGY